MKELRRDDAAGMREKCFIMKKFVYWQEDFASRKENVFLG
jgi:hypothetical protein